MTYSRSPHPHPTNFYNQNSERLRTSRRPRPNSRVLFLSVLSASLLAAAVGAGGLDGYAGAAVHGTLRLEDAVF